MASQRNVPKSHGDLERLPTNVKPLHYDLHIKPNLNAARFEGTVTIQLEVLEATTSITLNTLDLSINYAAVTAEHGIAAKVKETRYDEETSTTLFQLIEKLPAPSQVDLTINFTGRMDNQAVGFFRSSYQFEGTTRYLGSTQMEPVTCRRVFPCFDEPALKAKFSVTLHVDEGLTCVGNMPVLSETRYDGHKQVKFETTPQMSTYLVAFVVGEFNLIQTDDFRVPIRVWATKDKNIEQGRFALNLAVRALKMYETTFEIDFPLPKLDMMGIPGHRGGMENWGLVLYGESLLLVDNNASSASAIQTAGSVVVHELAHQWFGNIVTMGYWNDLWLNESFADWATIYVYRQLNPEWKQELEFLSSPYQEALSLDSDQKSHPIEVPVKRAKDISQIFDAISYSKGCAVLLTIADYLGDEKFLRGIRLYLSLHKYGNATAKDLWEALSHESGQDVGKIMSTLTSKAGYPVLTVEEKESSGIVSIEQHRFLATGTKAEDDLCYPVFLNIRTKSETKRNIQLVRRKADFKIPLDFYKINANQKGFYRVAYSEKRLQILAKNAKQGLLSDEDRIGIISDATALASAGVYETRITSVLSLLQAFVNEQSFFVWREIFASLQQINQAWTFDDSGVPKSLLAFQKHLVAKALHEHGWNFDTKDDIIEKRLKSLLFANSAGDPAVLKAAFKLFDRYLAGKKRPINPNIREAVFALVLEHGSVREYNAVLSGIYDAESPDERDTCLQTLGQARSPQLIQRTLKLALNDEILSIVETIKVIKSLASHREGREALWKWLQTRWDEINRKFSRSMKTMDTFVEICVTPLGTLEQLDEVRRFFKHKDTSSYNFVLSKAMNTIERMAKWAKRDQDDVEQWLKANGY